MAALLATAQKVFLYALLILIGLYAGMLFNHKMCPVETQLSPLDYARYWKIVDGTFMHTRMAIMGPGMGLLFMATLLLFIPHWRSLTFLFLVLSFGAFALDISFTLRRQLPINAFVNALDLRSITTEQLTQLTQFQAQAIANFDARFVHSLLSFFLLCLAPFFLPRLARPSE